MDILVLISCKKPKSGNYIANENGVKTSCFCPMPSSCTTSTSNYSTSNTIKIVNSGNSILYIDNNQWTISKDSVFFKSNNTTNLSPGSNLSYTNNYRGKITDRKNIEGDFIIYQTNFNGQGSITYDTIIGKFKYTKK